MWTCNKEAGLPHHFVVHTIHREVTVHAVFCGCHFVIRDKIFDHLVQKNDTNLSHAFEYRRKNLDDDGSACI